MVFSVILYERHKLYYPLKAILVVLNIVLFLSVENLSTFKRKKIIFISASLNKPKLLGYGSC